ncbi:MBOAT family O-acyltransferase [Anaerocolumna sp. AGMB13020]|uniref:MBOAT family O-acyltransferase n=1 Tax=Anaerocolumna sp. AGMB13020 TaxID=3081750 RepID=UPI002955B25F|nr:MBOAT family O-acyltransferase [Anaerocolumna sp. AGMB13020]WOO35705.1 MBOAT family O-acyltransferase [Anaerocolumna sp. AGMB13020]
MKRNKVYSRIWLIAALLFNFGVLFFFKYINFAIENINVPLKAITHGTGIASLELGLPLGISFYTFQAVAYVIDLYRGDCKENPNLFRFATYLVMFPKLVSGPIAVYGDMEDQLEERRYGLFKFEKGLKLFVVGLGMKVLIANRIGILWNDIQTIGFESISTPLAWLGSFGYSLQLYFDFQGYSLMAIGIGRMLGFHLPENFNHPYMSKSMTEFWRRWHMTLGAWFRNYVYIPLGGNRKGNRRLAINMLVVWLLTGLWHGASWNFVLWGLVLFLLILLEKLYFKRILDNSRIIARIYMLLAIPLTWTLFAISNLRDAGIYFGRMFGIVPGINVNAGDFLKYLGQYKWLFLVGLFFCFPYGKRLFEKFQNSIFCTAFLFLVFWYSIYLLANGVNNPFLYFQF